MTRILVLLAEGSAAPSDDDFFTHLHDRRAMANVTRMAASEAGRWNLGIGITLTPATIVNIASPILIY